MMKRQPLAAVLIAIVFSCVCYAEPLSLEGYLDQIRLQNQNIQAAQKSQDAARLQAKQADLMLGTSLFANGQALSDAKPSVFSSISGSKTESVGTSIGASFLNEQGISSQLSYNLTYTNLVGASGFVDPSNFFESRIVFDVTKPLLRNANGTETLASQRLISAQSDAQILTDAYRITLILADAEMTYWRLVLAREAVDVQRKSLARSQRMVEWAQTRVNLSLADQSDLLLARSGQQVRTLELQAAIDEEEAATRAFNSLRGSNDPIVSDTLSDLGGVSKIQVTSPNVTRSDLQAAALQLQISELNSTLGLQRMTATLNLFGTVALNSKDENLGANFANTFSLANPTLLVGVRYNTATDARAVEAVRTGFKEAQNASRLAYERKQFEVDWEWKDLLQKLSDARKRLDIAQQIEYLQRDKWQYEMERHQRGRTTIFQVITFEQDYANAQFARIRAQADILRIVAQLNTFRG
jgi:outer membrane protein TolC